MRVTCCNLKSYVKEVQGVTTKLDGMWIFPLVCHLPGEEGGEVEYVALFLYA